jgi:hypothetical protein
MAPFGVDKQGGSSRTWVQLLPEDLPYRESGEPSVERLARPSSQVEVFGKRGLVRQLSWPNTPIRSRKVTPSVGL